MSKKGYECPRYDDECCNKWFYMEDRKGSINKAKDNINDFIIIVNFILNSKKL